VNRVRFSSEAGVTLVESLVVMFIVAIIGTATNALVISAQRTERVTQDMRVGMDETRQAMDMMRRDLRSARRVYGAHPNASLPASSELVLNLWVDGSEDNFQDLDEQITYELIPEGSVARLERRTADGAAPRVLARNLDLSAQQSRFQFDVAPPLTRTVSVTLTAQGRFKAASATTVEESVRLRNVRS
jgi:prepilin-type N-terminal cleavage/methylation domain-containing protein